MPTEIRNTVALPVDIPVIVGRRKPRTSLVIATILLFSGIFFFCVCYNIEDPAAHWTGPISEQKAKEFRIQRADNKQLMIQSSFLGSCCILISIPFVILRIKAPYMDVYETVQGYEFTEP